MKKIDVFAALNLGLFLVLGVFRYYYARFIEYREIEHIEEFFLYAVVILGAIVVLWWFFRQHRFDAGILILLELGIVMHFSGTLVLIDGGRLYDAQVLGIRYDKYVHFVNTFTTTLLVSRLFEMQRIAFTLVNRVFLLMVVLGLGGLFEIVEYVAVQTFSINGVGGYDNNMQDLIANLCGSLSFLILSPALARRPRQERGADGG